MKKPLLFLFVIYSLSVVEITNADIYLGGGVNRVQLADDDWTPQWSYQFVLGRQWPTFWSYFNFYGEIFIEQNQGTLKNKLRELSDLDIVSDNDIIVHEYTIKSYDIERMNYGYVFGIKAYLPGKRLYLEAGTSFLFQNMNYKRQKYEKYFTAPPEEMRGKVDYKAKDYLTEGGNQSQLNIKSILGMGYEIIHDRLALRFRYNNFMGKVITSPSYDASSRCREVTVDFLLSL